MQLEPVTLTGSLVRLEPLALHHVAALMAAAAEDRSSYRYTSVPNDVASMRSYVDTATALWDKGQALAFATVDARSGRVVGSTRFGNIEWWPWPSGAIFPPQPAGCPDAVEIGWTWLAGSAQRTGINTEAKLLMLRHAFDTWDVHRVSIRTDARNARSRAAIERLGSKLDGVLRSAQPAYDGQMRDTASYSILRDEWPDVRERLQGLLRRS